VGSLKIFNPRLLLVDEIVGGGRTPVLVGREEFITVRYVFIVQSGPHRSLTQSQCPFWHIPFGAAAEFDELLRHLAPMGGKDFHRQAVAPSLLTGRASSVGGAKVPHDDTMLAAAAARDRRDRRAEEAADRRVTAIDFIIRKSQQIPGSVDHQENWIDVRLGGVGVVFGVYGNVDRSPSRARGCSPSRLSSPTFGTQLLRLTGSADACGAIATTGAMTAIAKLHGISRRFIFIPPFKPWDCFKCASFQLRIL